MTRQHLAMHRQLTGMNRTHADPCSRSLSPALLHLAREEGGLTICEKVGDAMWLAADLQEPCFVGAHLTVVLLVSLPQILVYTVGLPLAATFLLYRRRERLGDKQVQFRWGLLYAGFRHKVWW